MKQWKSQKRESKIKLWFAAEKIAEMIQIASYNEILICYNLLLKVEIFNNVSTCALETNSETVEKVILQI